MNARRFDAVIDKKGYVGCKLSHLAIIEKCRTDVAFMILEDDCVFLNDMNPYVEEAIRQLDPQWDMLHLGASPHSPQERYSENLFRLRGAYTTHAIIYHPRENGAVDYILRHKGDIKKIDVYYAEYIQSLFNVFVVYPMILTQRDYNGQSDTCSRCDTKTIEKNYNQYCR